MKFLYFIKAVFLLLFVFDECLAKRDLSRDPQMEHALHLVDKWNHFKTNYDKSYPTLDEELLRMTIFILNMIKVERLNQKHKNDPRTNLHLYCNKFGDLTHVEYQKNVLMSGEVMRSQWKKMRGEQIKLTSSLTASPNRTIPESIDWRELGAVTHIKNQKFCASCYAFVATGAIEAQIAIKSGQLFSLSEQQILDCSLGNGNMGCNMGAIDLSFDYIRDNGGIVADDSYPYKAKVGKCRFNQTKRIATLSHYINLENGDEEMLKRVVAIMGPVAVNIDASNINFMFYQGGILVDHTCSQQDFNHGVLVVGYGTEDVDGTLIDYWLCKNQFGEDWGENGYIRIARNQNNMCGLASAASIPVLRRGNIFLPAIETSVNS